MNRTEKSKYLGISLRTCPKGTLTGNKHKNIPFEINNSNGFFSYIGGHDDL